MKTRLSEKYETIPSNNVDQYIKQIDDNPLSLNFIVMSKTGVTETVQMNAETVMSGLTPGKSYGISLIFLPSIDSSSSWPNPANGKYEYTIKVNGFTIVKKSFTGD
jgi:hypothetical protein